MKEAIELRNLAAKDTFPMFTILSKIGFKEFKTVFESEDVKTALANAAKGNDADSASVGVAIALNIASIIFENIAKAENEIYQFISNISGMSKADVAELPMSDFAEVIIMIVTKEEFKDFFGVVSKLFK